MTAIEQFIFNHLIGWVCVLVGVIVFGAGVGYIFMRVYQYRESHVWLDFRGDLFMTFLYFAGGLALVYLGYQVGL